MPKDAPQTDSEGNASPVAASTAAETLRAAASPSVPANRRPARRVRNGRKDKLGRRLHAHVDASAAAFPMSILSERAADGLRPADIRGILTSTMTIAAVFWDRDNTLIEDPGYLEDPDAVKLLPGAADAIRRLREAGFRNIVVTNQSGIARGMFDEATLAKVHERLHELLRAEGADVDAIYYCPYLPGPEAVVEKYRQDSDLRKPKPGMLAQASLEHKIELAASWMIGNSLTDTQAGRAAGCRTILIGDGKAARDSSVDFVAPTPAEAARIVLERTIGTGAGPAGSVATSAASSSPSDDNRAIASTLQEILQFMRTVDRRQQSEDFSLARLCGMVVQVLAVAAFVWSLFGIIRGADYGAQIVQLLLAGVLQLIALTCFVLSGHK